MRQVYQAVLSLSSIIASTSSLRRLYDSSSSYSTLHSLFFENSYSVRTSSSYRGPLFASPVGAVSLSLHRKPPPPSQLAPNPTTTILRTLRMVFLALCRFPQLCSPRENTPRPRQAVHHAYIITPHSSTLHSSKDASRCSGAEHAHDAARY